MRGLIYKDIYLIKNKILLSFIMLAFIEIIYIALITIGGPPASPQAVSASAGLMDIMIVLYIGLVNVTYLMKADNSRGWGLYAVTLPEGEKSDVAAKYMTLFLVYFAAFAFCVVNDILCSFIAGETINHMEIYFVLILFLIFLHSIEMPLAFRFGSDKAGIIRILITLAICFILSIYLLFGNIGWLMDEDGLFTVLIKVIKEMVDAPEGSGRGLDALSGELKRYVERMTLKSYIVFSMLPHLVVLFYYISYRISCRVFKKGVLRDDI